jgi:class 3 adenylate cyclase
VIPETRWAKTVDGAYIAYQDFGGGPVTIVVIHGWITHLEVLWELPRCARFMRRLAERMRVLHFDKRGTGMSDRFTRPPNLDARMDDVRAVMDAARVDRAALFAWGDGGPPLATFFAATNPDRTLALCIDPHIQLKRAFDYPFENIEVRSGIHTGEVERLEDKVGGIAVTIGARICGLAGASEVLASRTVRDLVAGSGLAFADRGEHELKGVPGVWQLFSVTG